MKKILIFHQRRRNDKIKHFNDPNVFIKCLNDIQDVYKNIEKYNIRKNRKILIVFDDMITDMINKKLDPVVTELLIRGRKLNISVVFSTQSCFKVPKDV